MDLLTIITVLIFISAAFSYFNERFMKLPGTIGVVMISVLVSVVILIAGKSSSRLTDTISTLANSINFSEALLNVMLGFLMFASALHFDYKELKASRQPVFLLSTLGVILSAAVFSGLLYLTTSFLNIDLPFIYCLLFGTLISPTDPIAVSAILKNSKIPTRLNTIISGESMFNDGIGLVLFVVVLNLTRHTDSITLEGILVLFAREVIGGVIIGAVMGYLGYRLIRSIRDYQTILLISIALVAGISVIASKLESSIPLAAVTAGLIIGNQTVDEKQVSESFLGRIWQLLDEVLNTVLFVMIGLQLVALPFLQKHWLMGIIAIVITLIARVVSVSLPAVVMLRRITLANLSILTWAGLRGGISVAMALTLPQSPYREIILSSCYFVVIFSIIVQGLTLDKVVERAVGHAE